jgi:tRNA U38,U39,U40 pseudouridine synthase TruA
MATILAARDRSQAGETAPAEGLYFTQVDYDDATIVDPLTENLQLDQ